MKLNKAALVLLLPLLISACDSQQPTYSASNANSAPPPPAAQPAPPPAPPVAEPAASMPVAETRPAAAAPKSSGVDAPRHVAAYGGSLPEHEALAPVKPIGIGSCDSYIERYRTCVNNGVANRTMPNPSKFALVHTFNRQVRKWQADVAAGNTAELVTACAEAEKQAREELVKAGCTSF